MSRALGDMGDYSAEIIALLNQVGKRLSFNERERSKMRLVLRAQDESIKNMEEKAERDEKALLILHDKLSKRETVEVRLLKRQERLERQQREQIKKLEKASSLSDKLEETIVQQNRLFRRLEKMAQDRTRTLRKLERIEETVLGTQEALNAKAMVLLTDQNIAGKTELPQQPAAKELEAISVKKPANEDNRLWHHPANVQFAVVILLLLLAGFGGWTISRLERSNFSVAPAVDTAFDFDTEAAPYMTYDDIQMEENYASPAIPSVMSRSTDVSPFSEILPEEAIETEDIADVNSVPDDETLLAALIENPDALAEQLNDIAPTSVLAAPEEQVPLVEEPVEERAEPIVEISAMDQDVADFVEQNYSKIPLMERIKPDPTLPDIVKAIEKKAFAGDAEAQHDLAAIYTAGHGGITVDFKRAGLWFEEAAYRGISNARYNLGVLYHQGMGVEQDINKAVGWYRAAAQLGHPEAQYNLGIAYIEGIGTDYDPHRAAAFFEQAANNNIMEAAYNLGLIYENGLLGEARVEEALRWYKKSSGQGNAEAQVAYEQLSEALGIDKPLVVTPKVVKESKAVEPAPSLPAVDVPIQIVEAATELSLADREEPFSSRDNNQDYKSGDLEDREQVILAQIQEQLIRLGMYPGPADGINGVLMEDSILSYQADNGLPTDGIPSESLLSHMLGSEESGGVENGEHSKL